MKRIELKGEGRRSACAKSPYRTDGALTRLVPLPVAKPWGRAAPCRWDCGLDFSARVGEVHHLHAEHVHAVAGSEALLLKTLYAETVLSVQVHPDAVTAARLGLGGPGQACAKDEAWFVLEADAGARVGLGLRETLSSDELRAAVLDGSIVEALIWHEVRAGDALMVPAGTVHAIGAGVTLFEVQQNLDVTFRLHDHGRGRRLDVEHGLMVATRDRWTAPRRAMSAGPGRETLVSGGGFVMERVQGRGGLSPEAGRPVWVAAISGDAMLEDMFLPQGFVALVSGAVQVDGDAGLLLAQAGPLPQPGLWTQA